MAISIQEARNLLTKGLVAVYKERPKTTGFLRSFFPAKESMTEKVSIEVRRGTEKIAVDVKKYDDGNLNIISKSTERLIVPPMYHEYIVANDHDLYQVTVGAMQTGQGETFFKQLVEGLAEDMGITVDKMERAMEKQCADVLETGVIQLANNTNIDFNRKSASMLAYAAGRDFSIGTVDPKAVFLTGLQFLREKGKSQGSVYNAILGNDVLVALLNNPLFQKQGDIKDWSLDSIREPQRNAVGGTLHGQISVGAYKVNLWSYPEVYDVAGVSTPYVNDKKMILLPENPNFVLAFAAVPQLIQNGGTIPQKGAYLFSDYYDMRNTIHEMHAKTRPVAIPVAVDQIWTAKILN